MPEGFYCTVIRRSGGMQAKRVAYLLGPYGSKPEADARLGEARRRAGIADPWTAFDAFGVTKVTARELPKAAFGLGETAP